MAKVGRPSKYKPEYCEKIVELMGSGLSKTASSAELDIHKDSLYEWEKVHPEFSDAIKQGQRKHILFWEKIGMQGVSGELPGFNASAWIFTMKNKLHWVDKSEQAVKHSGGTDNKITIELVDAGSGKQKV